jgi:hypothetical protein
MSKPQESVDPIVAKFDEVLSRGLTLKERFARMIGSVREALAAGRYPESRREAVVHRTLEYIQEIAHGDYIARADVDQYVSITNKFGRDLWAFEQPPVVPSFHENLAAHHVRLQQIGWTGREIEALGMFAAGGPGGTDRIISCTVDSVTLASNKTITRAEIRDGLCPAWQLRDEWEGTREFIEMREAHAASVANEQLRLADQVVRISAGPARMIGKVA